MTENISESMLADKNLTILEDQLNVEALAIKKYVMYKSQCTDPNLKNVLEHAEQMHRKHFETLFNYLQQHNKPMQ